MNVNKVILIGRLTRDPEIRTTPSGQTVAMVGLATSRKWTDKSGQKQEKAEFHNIVLWGKQAEVVGQYMVKGQEAYFEGRLETRKFTGKDGVERKTTDVVAEKFEFGSKAQGSGGSGNFTAKPSFAGPKKADQPEEEIPTINLDEEQSEIKIEDVPF